MACTCGFAPQPPEAVAVPPCPGDVRLDDGGRWSGPATAMMDDAIIGCGTTGLIMHWNAGAEGMFGYTAAEMIGQAVTVLAPRDRAGVLRAALRGLDRGVPPKETETVLRRKDGALRMVTLRAAPVHDQDDRPIGVSILLRDVTETRRQADDLSDARARLALMESQLERLARLAAMERVGLNLAHELNQPLSAIVNYARAGQLLLGNPSAANLERLSAALDGVMTQSLHAGQIVGGVRAFVTRGETEKIVAPVSALVQEAVALVMPANEPHRVSLSLDLDPEAPLVLVDRVQIRQVLVNLIRNAVQAMQDGPRGALRIASRWVGGCVEISIADSGKGLPAAMSDRLFEPFATTSRNGTGLGLTICQTIVTAHGGTLTFQPGPDGGSIFRFTVTGVAEALS
jgi:two-component system, LuxR family, sensor kinase FixL